MKKFLIRLVLVVVVLVVLVVVVVGLNLNSAIKKGVETIGPKITKVDVKLEAVNLSLFSGSGSLKGLVVGNPPGYKTPYAISVGNASVSVSPGSVFSDKVVVKSIRIAAPEINYEGDVLTDNLRTILKNMSGDSSGAAATNAVPKDAGKPGKRLQVDEFIISGAKVNVNVNVNGLAKVSEPVVIPDIKLPPLGQGPEGITSEELSQKALAAISDYVLKYAVNKAADVGKEAVKKAASEELNKATEGLGNLLKKK